MSDTYMVKFKFEVTVGSAEDEWNAVELARGVLNNLFGSVLAKEFDDGEAFPV